MSFQPLKLIHVLAAVKVLEISVVGRFLCDECVQEVADQTVDALASNIVRSWLFSDIMCL